MNANLPGGAEAPAIGLGTFPFSGGFSPIDQATAQSVVETFLSMGGWYIETAAVYPTTTVDLGAILRTTVRSQVFVATKCVTGRTVDGQMIRSGKSAHLRAQCEAELARLGLDYLDLLQLHTVPEDAAPSESIGTLQELKQAGLTRNIGVSNVSLDQLIQFNDIANIDFVQNRFSYLHRTHHTSIADYCQRNGVLLNPYQVVERGLLTSSPPEAFREGDIRNSKYEYSGDVYHFIRAWALEHLGPLAVANQRTTTELAIGWAMAQPAIGILSIGATRPFQIQENMNAASNRLSAAVIAKMDQAYAELEQRIRDRVGLSVDEYRGL